MPDRKRVSVQLEIVATENQSAEAGCILLA